MKPSHESSIAALRGLRERAWQRLVASVPIAIAAVTERKAEWEAQIEASKKLNPRDQSELDGIRGILNQIDRAKACALLNRLDLDPVQRALRERAIATGGRG